MSDPSYRYARQADAPALVTLIERAYRGPETAGSWASEAHLLKGPRTSLDEVLGLIAREDSRFLIAERDGKVAGCCLLQGLSQSAFSDTSGETTRDFHLVEMRKRVA